MTAAPIPIILCADDFGISEGVNNAILDLAARGRLSAVTCMSGAPAWEKGAPLLKRCAFTAGTVAGLHVTLTHLPPLVKDMGARHPSEKEIVLKSWLRRLDARLIEQEVRAQFDLFVRAWEGPPAFIDGHQHVHVLPVIRDIVLQMRDRYAPDAWVRNVAGVPETPKGAVLSVLGWRFRRLLAARGISHNARMRGSYDLENFAAAMRDWCGVADADAAPLKASLAAPTALPRDTGGGRLLVYCHPGFPDAELARHDTLLAPRQKEYDFLSSDAFGAWLGKHIVLAGRP